MRRKHTCDWCNNTVNLEPVRYYSKAYGTWIATMLCPECRKEKDGKENKPES